MVTGTATSRVLVAVGEMLVITGAGFAVTIVNALFRLPLLPSGFVTVTVRAEDVFWMLVSTVMFVTSWVELTNATELTAIRPSRSYSVHSRGHSGWLRFVPWYG